MPNTETEYLDEEGAARLLGVAPNRLNRWRRLSRLLDNPDLAPAHNVDDAGNASYRRRKVIEWREHVVFPPAE